ncbi:SAV_2336 N-terminal domain-related protein [Paraburkholderia hospita]|uniref:SAV_2336 N-terminal domain-related protein n=1 Tax=Paraburkholderia hospita TaxID=169430 RepID=UPI000DF00BCC|nr:SAV_2336 N-terminal domain-related protein [Paraburkholderia hospita]AXE97340.1 hypothetical protein CUJ88_01750 [Paraburkholderia hospita]
MSSSVAAKLCRAHLLALGTDPDPGALADVVWLGLQLALRGAALPEAAVRSDDLKTGQVAYKRGSVDVQDSGSRINPAATPDKERADSVVPVYPSYSTHPFGKIGASRINIPAGESLPQRLRLERALKPFKRRLPSLTQRELDPNATAEASAEWRSITPVYRASPERWFEVALLAEASDAMHVWDTTLLELRRTLARHGAFRRVRLWQYAMREEALVLSTPGAAVAAPRILVDPQGRRLCWFVTTGTSPLWQHAALTNLVATLGRYGPTAIVQLMPYHTWPHTLLGDASEEALAHAPGTPTARLWLRDPFTGQLERASDALTVPVTSLEPARLEAWARFSMATRQLPHAAIRLKTEPLAALAPAVPRTEAASPRQRIAAFRAIASSSAFQLLRILSGIPLSLPVMRLMQMGMPNREQVHLAEILLSGLIERVTPADADLPADLIQYEFLPGIREELLGSLTLSEGNRIDASVSQIAEQARRFVEAYAGSASATFPGLVRNPIGDERLLEQAQSFLSVSQNLRPLIAKGLSQREGDSRAGVRSAVSPAIVRSALSPAIRRDDGFNFLSEERIKEHVRSTDAVVVGASELHTLLFFSSDRQHCWLVASNHAMAVLLDDAESRREERLVQHTSSWFDALPVAAKRSSRGKSTLTFGSSNASSWNYSSSLFPSPRVLEDAIMTMIPGGRDGALMRLRGLAHEYDEMRVSVRASPARTGAMQNIVNRIAGLPPLLEPDVTLATESKSAGIRLLAIVALQRRFEPAHIRWLFDCIVGEQAFLAYQAVVTLNQAAPVLHRHEQVQIRGMAIDTKHKLQAAGREDVNVHRLLDELAALPAEGLSSVNGRETRRILIGSTGWELAEYRAQAVQLLESLGHEIVNAPTVESASDLQVRLEQMEVSDIVLLLVGTRNEYGQAAQRFDSNKILLVEFEYQEAARLRKPIMVFMLEDETFSNGTYSRMPDRMARFREMLLKNHLVQLVRSPKDFEESLYRALNSYSKNIPKRMDAADDEKHIDFDLEAWAKRLTDLVDTDSIYGFTERLSQKIDEALDSADWQIDASSTAFWDADDPYAVVDDWKFGGREGLEFSPLQYRDGIVTVRRSIRMTVRVNCSFSFSVRDGIDKDMVHLGDSVHERKLALEIGAEFEFSDIEDYRPTLQRIAIDHIAESVDFGTVEPFSQSERDDYDDEDS